MIQMHNLAITVESKPVVANFSLTVGPGQVHAIMGPNGSGKSSLAYTLAGHPRYTVTHGKITLNGIDITNAAPDVRARSGLFLAFQYPQALPGVSVATFLKEAHAAVMGKALSAPEFMTMLEQRMAQLEIDPAFAQRSLNDGFSGGEKKRLELLQLLVLQPRVAVLDEIDSGLDIDALKLVGQGLRVAQQENPDLVLIIITHYQRILQYITPDRVHIMYDGTLVDSGDATLVTRLETEGYDGYRAEKKS